MFPFSSHSSTTSFVSGGVQSGSHSLGWMSGQSCRRKCRCRPDGSCKCRTSCRMTQPMPSARTWATPSPSRRASFDDTGWSGELGRSRRPSFSSSRWARGGVRRGGWSASPRLGGYQPWALRSGQTPRLGGYSPRSGQAPSGPQQRWRQLAAMRQHRSRRVARTLRSNGMWARRLGWGRHAPRIAQALGSRSAIPWSLPFARAVARWQRRRGFSIVDGVLSPRVWMLLRQSLAGGPTPMPPDQVDVGAAMPPQEPAASGMDAGQDAGANGWANPPSATDAPIDQASSDGGAAPDAGDPGDASSADAGAAGGDDAAGEWYELARWAER